MPSLPFIKKTKLGKMIPHSTPTPYPNLHHAEAWWAPSASLYTALWPTLNSKDSYIWCAYHCSECSKSLNIPNRLVCAYLLSIRLFATPWTSVSQAPLSMGLSWQEYWRGLPCPPPWDLPHPGIKPASLVSPALAGRFFTAEPPQFSQFSRSVVSDSLQPHELQHTRPPCPSPTPRVHSDSSPSSQWCHLAISSSVVPFSSYPQSLLASESFPMSQLFAWGGQSTGVSALASVLPKKSQGWSPSEWTAWICLQSKGLSRVFSNTTVQKHQFFSAQPSSHSNSHIHTWPQEKP